ncbi:MAG: HAD-IA family hydrolase [Patescibacteria group bacterium]
MKCKAILFDADGVVIRGERFSLQYTRDYGVPTETLDPFFRTAEFAQCLVGKQDLKEIIAPYVSTWEWKGSVDELLEYWFRAESVVDTELIAWIQTLRVQGIRCYLATNNEKYRTQYLRDVVGLGSLMDGVFSSSEIGVKKHDPRYFEAVLTSLAAAGIAKDEVVLFDDLQANIDCAQQFGFAAHFYTTFADAERWLTEQK